MESKMNVNLERFCINAPEGYVIDTEKSTATEVFFKPIEQEKKFPMSWEDLQKVEGGMLII